MLQMKISTKQQLLRLLQEADIKQVIAKDIHFPSDFDDFKKSALQMLRSRPVTVILVSN